MKCEAERSDTLKILLCSGTRRSRGNDVSYLGHIFRHGPNPIRENQCQIGLGANGQLSR